MKKLRTIFFSLGLIGSVLFLQPTAFAAGGLADKSCSEAGATFCSGGGNAQDLTKNLINALLTILGAICVIVIVVGGIKYTTSDGDAGKIKGAKDTILYAIIGLIIAMLSYAIVNFIVDRFAR